MYHFDKSIIAPFAEQYLTASDDDVESTFKALMLNQIEQKLEHNIPWAKCCTFYPACLFDIESECPPPGQLCFRDIVSAQQVMVISVL